MSEPDAPRPQTSPAEAPAARLVLERVQGATLHGWAHDPATPGQERLQVRCGETTLDATVRRLPRGDVQRALQAQVLALGFELELPHPFWEALAAAGGAMQLVVNGVALPHAPLRPTLAGLTTWVERLSRSGAEASPAEHDQRLARLQEHLQLARQWLGRLGESRMQASAVREPAAGHVERWNGLLLQGWVADSPTQRASIRLRAGDRLLEVPVRRTSRADVARHLLLDDDLIGFEMEVPGTLWEGGPDATTLVVQVVVDGQACGEPQRLQREQLSDAVDAALARAEPADREQQVLLALEHLAHAGALDSLDDRLRSALAAAAQAAGAPDPWRPADPAGAARVAAQRSVPARAPMRVRPRGRLGRWLALPGNAERALALLLRLRARPWMAPLAERVEVALTLATGLFDKALYEDQVPASRHAGLSALRHYVRHGDAQSLVPQALFDPRHYTGQLPGRRHPGINRLLHWALWGRRQGLSPSPWWDPQFYLARNADVAASGQDAWLHFVNWGWAEHRSPHPEVHLTQQGGGDVRQRLVQGQRPPHPDPRVNLLRDGLPAGVERPADGRLPWMPDTELDGRDHLLLAAWRGLPRPKADAARVDVVVPVYAGVQETLRCLWSVLDSDNQTPFALVVVDDCSPDPALSAMLRELARLGLIHLLVNAENQGFVQSVNLGLSLHWDRDVVILNADTRVHPGWLDRLCAHAQAEPRAASITPMSNHATICSYPSMPGGHPPPQAPDDGALDALAAEVNRGGHVEAPTGVGFCMWMRRACLDAIGLLDAQRFGRGYGEENDWCQRALAAGWVHLIAADVFVMHQGSVSFAGEMSARVRAALATLAERHPNYAADVDRWIGDDPMRPWRARLDAARLREQVGRRVVVMVSHARGGGTARHEAEQAQALRAEGVGTLYLRPSRQAGRVALCGPGMAALPNLDALPLAVPGLLGELLGHVFEVQELQVHHLVDHDLDLMLALPALCRQLGTRWTVTLHDYHAICPRLNLVDGSGRYCGEPDFAGCRKCLRSDGMQDIGGGIQAWRGRWRTLLNQADAALAPDEDVPRRLKRYFPQLPITVRPHEPLPPSPASVPDGSWPPKRVLVVGALSRIKGHQVLLDLARQPALRAADIRFTLLGHSVDDAALREAGVEVLGRYEDAELAKRIEALAPDLVWLPSVWPETFCYVLTTAMAAHVRIAVFDLGAQARRLRAWDPQGTHSQFWPLSEAAQPAKLAQRLLST